MREKLLHLGPRTFELHVYAAVREVPDPPRKTERQGDLLDEGPITHALHSSGDQNFRSHQFRLFRGGTSHARGGRRSPASNPLETKSACGFRSREVLAERR